MGQLNFTTDEVNKTIDGRLNSPVQDVVGDNYPSGSPLAMSADTEYTFACNGNDRNFPNFPAHITNMWDTTNNKTALSEFQDTPQIVCSVQFTFAPNVAAAGEITIQPYVDETSPIPFKAVTVPYKKDASRVNGLVTFYAGSEAGFDIKNKGVYFKIKASGAGSAYDMAIELYRT